MADYIRCKNCDPIYCNGCNIKILETMLYEGKFDCLMDGNRSINQSADVAPVRHGRWINSGTGYNWCYECSACGWKDGHPFEDRHNYCPNCGAKMDGGADNG